MKQRADPNAYYDTGAFLRYYRAVNEARPEYLIHHLGSRGFCAELTSVARAMAYGWQHGLQLALDSSEFAYRSRQGWNDYFKPFCRDASEVPEDRVRERFRFENRRHFRELRAFDPKVFKFGVVRFDALEPRLAHFVKLIFHLGYDAEREVERLRRQLGLPGNYVALHIRRGDKVGDEDVFYPVERYFEALDALGGMGDRSIFVLSDDHQAVAEVRQYLEARNRSNRVVSLCRPEHTGFDVNKLREGKDFAGAGRALESEREFREYAWTETVRLLAEICFAAGSAKFVTTLRSNVGRTICYLQRNPAQCGRIG